MEEADYALQYALERLGRPSLILKPEQTQAIKSVLMGKDTFVWLPTGFGKSICFEALPFAYDYKLGNKDNRSLVLVISPLISLMVSQVITLRRYGVSAAVISYGKGTQKDVIASDEHSDSCTYSLLFCSPEALVSSKWRELPQQSGIHDRIVAVIVDEAHCVSKWYATLNH